MAIILYAHSSGGNNTNSGSSPSVKASGTGAATTAASAVVNLSADSPDLSTVVANDTIRLNARTDGYGSIAPNDVFVITAVDNTAKTVTVSPTPNSNTSGVTWIIGGAFATIRRAWSFAKGGDKVYARGTFTGLVDLTDADFFSGGLATTPITLEGYTTTPGDNGLCILDGQGSTANGLVFTSSGTQRFWVTKNFRVTNYTNEGYRNIGGYPTLFINCRADLCAVGFRVGALANMIHCQATDCTDSGFLVHDHVEFYGCIIRDNAIGIECDDGCMFYHCWFVDNTTTAILKTANFRNVRLFLVDSLIDGGSLGGKGIDGFADGGYPGNLKILNSMIIGCSTAVDNDNDDGLWNLGAGILVNGNTFNYVNYSNRMVEVIGAPTFVARGTDYTPLMTSPAVNSGYDSRASGLVTVTGGQAVIGDLLPAEFSGGGPGGAGLPGGFCDGWGWD